MKIADESGQLIFRPAEEDFTSQTLSQLFQAEGQTSLPMGEPGRRQATKPSRCLAHRVISKASAEALTIATKLAMDSIA